MTEPANVSLDTKLPEGTIPLAFGTLTMGLMRRPEAHPDSRGSVRETYRASWFPEVPPIKQLVQSVSRAGTLRGMHLHRNQWDVWRFTAGVATVRLYDTATNLQLFLDVGDATVLAIPPGISHGFYTGSGATLVYALTNEYDGTDEAGWWPFDDVPDELPALCFWPALDSYGLLISERDVRATRLADFKG